MRIYFNEHAVHRQTILTVFRNIGQQIPSLAGFWNCWNDTDFEPATAGLKLSQILAEQFNRQQQQILEQRHQIEALFQYNQNLVKSIDDSALAQARHELTTLQQQLSTARREALLARKNEEALKTILAQQQAQHERTIQAMEQQLADHRRLIARQHYELVDLMGEAYAQSLPTGKSD